MTNDTFSVFQDDRMCRSQSPFARWNQNSRALVNLARGTNSTLIDDSFRPRLSRATGGVFDVSNHSEGLP